MKTLCNSCKTLCRIMHENIIFFRVYKPSNLYKLRSGKDVIKILRTLIFEICQCHLDSTPWKHSLSVNRATRGRPRHVTYIFIRRNSMYSGLSGHNSDLHENTICYLPLTPRENIKWKIVSTEKISQFIFFSSFVSEWCLSRISFKRQGLQRRT